MHVYLQLGNSSRIVHTILSAQNHSCSVVGYEVMRVQQPVVYDRLMA